MNETQKLYDVAKKIIPGGTQLLSKRPEMHLPDFWPAYYSKAKGCEVWDLDENHYFDMSFMGIGSCILGYADDDINKAVKFVVDNGNMTTLNCYEEVELAQLLCQLHPWSEMVRYARTGGEAMAMAVRISRAKTKKDIVLFCGYHGWHDWYLSANLADDVALDGHLLEGLSPSGVPRSLQATSFPFKYNDKDGFLSLIEKYKGQIAAVVMEPIRYNEPKDGFLSYVRETTKKENIVFVFDEISSGWRINDGGAHIKFGVNPDIAVFGKGMSNGYPMAAVVGTRKIMEAAQETFISSTYWTERIGPAAAIATINKIKNNKVINHLNTTGTKIKQEWKLLAAAHNLDIEVSGMMPALCHFSFKYENSLAIKTLFTQMMLEKGFLATTACYVSYSHTSEIVENYFKAVSEVFSQIIKIIKEGKVENHLKGPICHSGFKRLT